MDLINLNSCKDPIQILLTLLSKSEQILGLINLPDNIILKYNQLKELTFEKLNLEYSPLRPSKSLKPEVKPVTSNLDMSKIRLINSKKTLILEYVFDLIDRFKFEKNQLMNHFLLENFAFQLTDKIRIEF